MDPRTSSFDVPRPLQLLNEALAPFGPDFPDLSFEAQARSAEMVARLSDWGTDEQRNRFRRMCEVVSANTNLTNWGHLALRIFFGWKMVNHLHRIEFVKRHPQVRDVPIEAPIVILGWYRTGTTLLHNLLGADPSHRLPLTWEISYPVPFADNAVRDRQMRRAMTSMVIGANRFVVPDQASAHYITVDGPEECFFLQENAGVSTTLFNTYQAYDYAYELLRDDLAPTFADHKLQLQMLSMGRPKRRWILKCPFHLWTIDSLLATYPDARIVWTHRDARKSLPSNCSLSAMTTSKFVKELDLERHGRFWADFYRVGVDRGLASRAKIPSSRIADVRMNDLGKDPVGTLRSVYDKLELPWSPGLEAAFHAEVKKHPKDAHGSHRYDLATFGLDEAEIGQRFADYHERFGLVKSSERTQAARP